MQHKYEHNFDKDLLIVDGLWPHSFMASEMPKCKVYLNSIKVLGKLARISSFGAEVYVPKSVFEEVDLENLRVKLEFNLFGNPISIEPLGDYNYQIGNNNVSFIFLFDLKVFPYEAVSIRRSFEAHLQIKRSFGVDESIMNIVAVSKTMLKVESSYKNRVILPGMKTRAVVLLPFSKKQIVYLEVKAISPQGGENKTIVDFEVSRASNAFFESLSNYVLLFGATESIDEFRDSGISTRSLKLAKTTRYCKTDEEYEEVLQLRYKSYLTRVEAKDDKVNLQVFADDYDQRSRIVMLYHQQKMVASVRVVFCKEDEKMEIENYIELPDHFPDKEDCMEISRLCIDPDYRRSDLLLSLFNEILLIALESKRNHALVTAPKDTAANYKRAGYRDMGVSFSIKEVMGNDEVELRVMGISLPDILRAKGINPLSWHLIYEDSLKIATFKGVLDGSGVNKIKSYLWPFLGRIGFKLYRYVKSRKK